MQRRDFFRSVAATLAALPFCGWLRPADAARLPQPGEAYPCHLVMARRGGWWVIVHRPTGVVVMEECEPHLDRP